MHSNEYITYLLRIADNALILGHRLSEWCGHGPVLEQDIAITNISLDHIGLARNLYQYIAELLNTTTDLQKDLFRATQLNELLEKHAIVDEDDLAYLRDAWDYRNVLLVEQPNQDWAYTIIRSFFYDTWMVLLLTELQDCTDERLSAIASKSLKEALYHKRWSSEWVIRLGDGTAESHERIKQALTDRWPYSGELFEDTQIDVVINEKYTVPLPSSLKQQWFEAISNILETATLSVPDPDVWMHTGGKKGQHSEHLGYILAELQFIQRAYPGMKW